MSLTAYDGMITRKGYKYLQEETIKRIDRFKDASFNSLAKHYAKLIIDHVDGIWNIKSSIRFDAINEKNILKEIEELDAPTLISYIFQASKILSKSNYVNDFTVHLNLQFELISNNDILIYPNILVEEHRNILLEYLDDWYCQNQTDPDKNISKEEWEERSRNWYDFNNYEYFHSSIQLFDPHSIFNNLNVKFRGEELFSKILNYIPSKQDRLNDKARHEILNYKIKDIDKDRVMYDYLQYERELKKENNSEIKNHIIANNLTVEYIDYEFIQNYSLK